MKIVTEIWKLWQRYKNCDRDMKIATKIWKLWQLYKNVCLGHCTHHLHVETVPADQGQLWREFQTFQDKIHHYRFKFSTFGQMNWTRLCFTGSPVFATLWNYILRTNRFCWLGMRIWPVVTGIPKIVFVSKLNIFQFNTMPEFTKGRKI